MLPLEPAPEAGEQVARVGGRLPLGPPAALRQATLRQAMRAACAAVVAAPGGALGGLRRGGCAVRRRLAQGCLPAATAPACPGRRRTCVRGANRGMMSSLAINWVVNPVEGGCFITGSIRAFLRNGGVHLAGILHDAVSALTGLGSKAASLRCPRTG